MKRSATRSASSRSRSRGFSMLELAVSLLIVLILSAIAIPTMMSTFRAYQLNDAAARVSDQLKFTRFEAVRRNTLVNFGLQQVGANWVVWTDSNNDGVIDRRERQVVIGGFATLLPAAGLPAPTPITTTLGVGTLNTLSGNPGSVTFDARGAVRTAATPGSPPATTVAIIYIGNAATPQFGYRAVVVLLTGATQVWASPPSSLTWQRVS